MVSAKNDGSNMLFVSMKDLPKRMERMYIARKNLCIEGPPGCGKSAAIKLFGKMIAKKLGYADEHIKLKPTADDWKDEKNFCVQTNIASQMDTLDTKGGIYNDKDQQLTLFFNTKLFPTKNWAKAKGILFFDEIGTARPDVQSALQPIFVDMEVNNTPLADVWVIGATNSIDDNSNVHPLSMALCNRFGWVKTDYLPAKDWVELMTNLNIHVAPFIGSYLMTAGEKMVTFDADSNHKAYGTPRSWLNASEYCVTNALTSLKDVTEGVAMFCGVSESEHFETFVKIAMSVNIDEILKKPEKILEINDKDPGLLYSVLFNLVDRVKSNDKNLLPVLKALGLNKYQEYNILTLRMLMNTVSIDKMVTACKQVPEIMKQMPEIMGIIKDISSMNN